MISDDSSPAPIAALAVVLAISIAACSTACRGRSDDDVRVKNSANSRATVILQLLIQHVADIRQKVRAVSKVKSFEASRREPSVACRRRGHAALSVSISFG
jgi:hypothetical protein